jgi:hypothetical protein
MSRTPSVQSFVCSVCGEEFAGPLTRGSLRPLPACPCCGADEIHSLGAGPAEQPPDQVFAA